MKRKLVRCPIKHPSRLRAGDQVGCIAELSDDWALLAKMDLVKKAILIC